jgi:hypothetical protein
MVRTFAYGLHRKKLIFLGKWPYAKEDKKYSKPKDQINSLSVALPGDQMCAM